VALPSGDAVLMGLASAEGVCAAHDPGLVTEVNAFVATVSQRAWSNVAHGIFGITDPLAVRYDWTWRTVEAEDPRSRGGLHTRAFRSIDADDPEVFDDGKGPSISLRLAREVPVGVASLRECDGCDWVEYSALRLHPSIGDRRGVTGEDRLAFLVAHEAAHAATKVLLRARYTTEGHSGAELLGRMASEWVESGMYLRVSPIADQFEGAHEAEWQVCYRLMREALDLETKGELSGLEVVAAKPAARGGLRLRQDLSSCFKVVRCAHCDKPMEAKTRADGRGGGVRKYCGPNCRKAASRKASGSDA
jgi:hypothetical protein